MASASSLQPPLKPLPSSHTSSLLYPDGQDQGSAQDDVRRLDTAPSLNLRWLAVRTEQYAGAVSLRSIHVRGDFEPAVKHSHAIVCVSDGQDLLRNVRSCMLRHT